MRYHSSRSDTRPTTLYNTLWSSSLGSYRISHIIHRIFFWLHLHVYFLLSFPPSSSATLLSLITLLLLLINNKLLIGTHVVVKPASSRCRQLYNLWPTGFDSPIYFAAPPTISLFLSVYLSTTTFHCALATLLSLLLCPGHDFASSTHALISRQLNCSNSSAASGTCVCLFQQGFLLCEQRVSLHSSKLN